jgi:hypothetical protein
MTLLAIKENIKQHKILSFSILLIVFIFILSLFPIILSGKNTTPETKNDEVTKLVEVVGKLMILPDETPIVATVVDLAKLKNQVFFESAKYGDKILIYPRAQKIILYNPKSNKIVGLAPFNINSEDGLLKPTDILLNTKK